MSLRSEAILLTVLHVVIFFLYTNNYSRLRKENQYRQGRLASFRQMPISQKITKFTFSMNALCVLSSFWFSSQLWGFFQVGIRVKISGLFIAFCGFLFLKTSLGRLGKNYSPLFDSHRPFEIVKDGPYRLIRHPVYAANMIIIIGYIVAGASLWSLLLGSWGLGYMISSIRREERYLAKEFPEYVDYQKKSWMVLPYVI